MKYVLKQFEDHTSQEIAARGGALKGSRVKDADGNMTTRYTIDFSSPTIDDDLTYVFGRAVEQARRENKRITGSADGVVRKR